MVKGNLPFDYPFLNVRNSVSNIYLFVYFVQNVKQVYLIPLEAD